MANVAMVALSCCARPCRGVSGRFDALRWCRRCSGVYCTQPCMMEHKCEGDHGYTKEMFQAVVRVVVEVLGGVLSDGC
jgi:hypothetical protein